jgi:hypothetical protein
MIKWINTLVAVLLLVSGTFAQDAYKTIDELVLKMNKIKDYSAEALITSDIPMVKILPSKATVYFKQKDKFKIDAKGIAIVPKQGFTDISKMLSDKSSYTAIFMGNENIRSMKTEIISIFPTSDTSDLILSKMWIDPVNDVVLKSQTTTRSSGMVTTEFTYGGQLKWGLPDMMLFTVDVKKFKIPKGVATDINKSSNKGTTEQTAKTGTVKIDLTNYKVNQGLSDALFK